jgi:hypothetical protein
LKKPHDIAVAELENSRPSGKQKIDPRDWQKWDDLFGKLKRATDKLNHDHSGEKFCRAVHSFLNDAHTELAHWRRSLR